MVMIIMRALKYLYNLKHCFSNEYNWDQVEVAGEVTGSHERNGYLPQVFILLIFATCLQIYMEYLKNAFNFQRKRASEQYAILGREGVKVHSTVLESGDVYPFIPQWQWLRITGQKTELLLEDVEVKTLPLLPLIWTD